MRSFARLVAACTLLAASAQAQDERRLDVAVLPGLSFSSDVGLGLGVSGAIYRRAPDRTPYAWALHLQLFATTRGIQDHALGLDLQGSHWRTSLGAGFFSDRYRPYFGIGNETSSTTPAGAPTRDDESYGLKVPFVRARFLRRLDGAWFGNIAYDLRWLDTTVRAGTRLDREAPTGAGGGLVGRVDLELLHDTRDEEASTTNGHYAAISGHFAAPNLGSRFTFGGFAAELRGFRSPLDHDTALVFAGRLLADVTWGDVPVSELPVFGGRSRIEGLGGASSLRGIPRYRYLGQAKGLANAEVRTRVHRFAWGERTIDLWAVAFVDAGRVWARVASDGPWWRLHYAAGAGVRIAWVRDFVARLDVGYGEGTLGVYGALDQLF